MHNRGWIWITCVCRGPYSLLVSPVWGGNSPSRVKPQWEVMSGSLKELQLSGSIL